jgi:hypothetical protein
LQRYFCCLLLSSNLRQSSYTVVCFHFEVKKTTRKSKENLYLCRGLTRTTYILCIEHRRKRCLWPGIEPGTSCTAGEHSMQRAIRTALMTAIRNLYLYYYSSPQAAMSQALDWGSWLKLDSDADIVDRTRGGPNSERGRLNHSNLCCL